MRAAERRLTVVLLLHNLFAVGAFTAGRAARDALFLAHLDRSSLPWMIIASALAVAVVGLLYAPLAARARRDRMAVATALSFAALFVAAFALEAGGAGWLYATLYVYVEVMGALSLVQFWTLANDLFHSREAKRLYGIIGAGGTLANILIGVATTQVAMAFGARALLLLCAALLGLSALASYLAGRVGRQRMVARAANLRESRRKATAAPRQLLASPHLRAVALVTLVTFFTTTLVDYQFKVIAASTFERDRLAAYFGQFYTGVGVLALGLQLFGTGKLLQRAGVIGALTVLPGTLLAGSTALLVAPALWTATLAKGADGLFRYAVNDAATQMLYLPISPQIRGAAKALMDGIAKPGAIALAGVALIAYRQWHGPDPYPLAWAASGLCGIWLVLVWALRGGYIASLQDNLRRRALSLAGGGPNANPADRGLVARALGSSNVKEVLTALELAPQLESVQLDLQVESLLDHPVAEVRMAALGYYARRSAIRFANSAYKKLEDPEPRVRAAAIDAICAIGRDKAVRTVKGYLLDPEAPVVAAAVTGMIRYGGLDGVLAAAETLKKLISHPDPSMREHAAQVLRAIGVRNFYQPVLQLMNDPQARVRRQAVLAAGELKSVEFVLPLIYKSRDRETLREAVQALSAFGEGIVPTLAKVLARTQEDPVIRRNVVRVLGRLPTPQTVTALVRQLQDPDEELRRRLYRALGKVVRAQPQLAGDAALVQTALDQELMRAWEILAASEALKLDVRHPRGEAFHGQGGPRALLTSALQEKLAQAEERLFLLLEVLYPDAGMGPLAASLRHAPGPEASRRRANAVELLDNLLPRELRRRLLPLLDEAPRAHKLREVAEPLGIPVRSAAETLERLCQDASPWVRACAVFYASTLPEPQVTLVSNACADPSALVRETALRSCAGLPAERVKALATPLLEDEVPWVRRQAERLAGRIA